MEILYSSTWNSISKIKPIILRPNWTTCSMSLKMVCSKSMSYLTYFSEANILIRWSRFLVVITTHSDPNTGDLHIAPDCAGAAAVDQVRLFCFLEAILIYSSSSLWFFQSIFATFCKGRRTIRISSICYLVGHSPACPPPEMLSKPSLLSTFLCMIWMTTPDINCSEGSLTRFCASHSQTSSPPTCTNL